MHQLVKNEEEILEFWQKNKIFAKTLEKQSSGDFVFYDGPPFATGLPHYGHLLASTIKDVVPRYKTMRGLRVNRRWGWDCHGLPVEVLVEEELGVKTKKDIDQKVGIEKFNEACRDSVLRYADEWKKIIPRIGRWVDMENDYKTMDSWYMESICNVFKSLWDKKLIYQDYRSVSYCPRCGTPLSNFEVNQGYKDNVEDPSVYIRFKLKDQKNTYFLVWTTTPWTLPGNVALAVGGNIDYVKIERFNEKTKKKENLILAEEALSRLKMGDVQVIEHYQGKNLVDLKYEELFDFARPNKEAYYVIDGGGLVSVKEGTGIVHIAPAYGEEDFTLSRKKGLPIIITVDPSGEMTEDTPWPGIFVKKADPLVIEDLKKRGLLFQSGTIKHTYPFCWRCGSPIYDYLWPAWFVRVEKIKDELIKNNKKINWAPAHLRDGRFGKWLEGARDWNISRNRYWGAPIPVWICKKCKHQTVIGSLRELEEKSGSLPKNKKGEIDLHRPYIDEIKIKCPICSEEMQRTPEILDCWFESGAMPYASFHYPFENKEWFEKNFPAQFIAEGLDQTRGWFYTLLVLSTIMFDKPAFLNVIANGLILAEDGRKMSKRLKNYPEPKEIINKYGADSLRYYLLTSPAIRANDLRFSEKGVVEVFRKVIIVFWNVCSFYSLHAGKAAENKLVEPRPKHILDQWILTKLNLLIEEMTEAFDSYNLVKAAKPLGEFINKLSTWYLRRSRSRIRSNDSRESGQALEILRYVLLILARLSAPFMPFISEKLYQELEGGKKSVHLEDWPEANKKLINQRLEEKMDIVRKICEIGHNLRKKAGIKNRQPLQEIKYQTTSAKIEEGLLDLIKDELNVKEAKAIKSLSAKKDWLVAHDSGVKVALDTRITPELEAEGAERELVRRINNLRKEGGLTIHDEVSIYFKTESEKLKKIIKKFAQNIREKTGSKDLVEGEPGEFLMKKLTEIDSEEIELYLLK